MEAALRLVNLTIGYRRRTVLADINLELPPASVTLLVGANGTGKSTLLKTISGVIPPLAGQILVDGRNMASIGRREAARLMAIVYTDRSGSAGGLTVRELVALGRQPHTGFLGRLGADDRHIVDTAMADVGIHAKADSFLSDISDGERQKAMIARALAQQTPIVLLDEPTSYLDAASRLDILALVSRLSRTRRRTILLSTHDTAPALAIADNVITITPADTPAVDIHPVGTPALDNRMTRIFPDRPVRYNPRTHDYEHTSTPPSPRP